MTVLIGDKHMDNTASVENMIRKRGGTRVLRHYFGDRLSSEMAGVNL
jgi:hypothetical protein